jgi:hypothetical protein
VRIDLFKSWVAGNPETQAAFDHQYSEFKIKHQNRDVFFESFYAVDINGYKPNILWVVEGKWWLNCKAYATITIIYLSSVFYRYWFDRCSVKANFQFIKIIKV